MKKIRILAISASPRPSGNTVYLREKALEVLSTIPFDTEVIRYSFAGKRFNACCGCLKCYTNGGFCVFKDNFEELRQLWLSADVVLYCTPVYHAGIPGQLKTFIDRLGNSLFGYYPVTCMRHMKAVGLIAQGGDFPGGQEMCALDIMRHCGLADCIYVAPDGSYFGSGAWADGPNGTELKAKVKRRTSDIYISLQTARSTLRRCVETAAILMQGAQVLSDRLETDDHYWELYSHLNLEE